MLKQTLYFLTRHFYIMQALGKKNPSYLLLSGEITLGQMFPKKYPVGVPDGRGCGLEITDSPEHTCVQQICLIVTDMLTLNSGSRCGSTRGATIVIRVEKKSFCSFEATLYKQTLAHQGAVRGGQPDKGGSHVHTRWTLCPGWRPL